ncbi:MAG: hypothetical protein WDN06_13410 [Asticcacaulis sp.]
MPVDVPEPANAPSPPQPQFTLWPWVVAGALFVPLKMVVQARAYADVRDKPISQWDASNWMTAQAITDLLTTYGFIALFVVVVAFFLWRNRQADLRAIIPKLLIGFVLVFALVNTTLKLPGLMSGL